MGIIRVMPPSLSRLIAAGEVVERPASVLKELLENSLDAGATQILVQMERGGLSRLRVSDDGAGMDADDLSLAFVRHASSKLYAEDQLDSILTFGFRGEALASIMEVARVRIQTRRPNDEVGNEVEALFGDVKPIHPFARQAGTTVEVDQLFARIPARLEFLGTPAAETTRCLRIIQALAIGNPRIRFQFVVDGRTLLEAPVADSLEERIAQVHGEPFLRSLLPVRAERDDMVVEGYVSRPDACPRRCTRSVLFVNGRPVELPRVRAAVRQVYASRLVAGQYPEMVLAISVPAHDVDPNVTPDKSEVRLRAESALAGLAYRAVEYATTPATPTMPPPGSSQTSPALSLRRVTAWAGERKKATQQAELPLESVATESSLRPSPVIVQLDNTLLLVPTEDGVFYVDQHSLHERILYEELRARPFDASSQELLVPVTISLDDPAELLRLEALLEPLRSVGFRLEPAGPRDYWIYATPAWSARREPARVLADAVRALGSDVRLRSDEDEVREALLRRLACHGAVKSGDSLTPAEIRELWRKAEGLDLALLDVHGRPGAVFVSFDQIYRRLGRS